MSGRVRVYRNSAAVLIPMIEDHEGARILFERRALSIDVQPGEISFPGGGHEGDETIEETAIRETMEELLIGRDQIELLEARDPDGGPGGRNIYPFAGRLHDYHGSFSEDEVDHVFTVPVEHLLQMQPLISHTTLTQTPADDFPFDLIPGGRTYPWTNRTMPMYFYIIEADLLQKSLTTAQIKAAGGREIIWGLTARILHSYLEDLRSSGRNVKFV